MKINKCVKRAYYEEDGTYIVEIDLHSIVIYYRNKGKFVPLMEDVQLEIMEELGLKKPFKIIFVEG